MIGPEIFCPYKFGIHIFNISLLRFNSITEAAIEEERRRELQDRLNAQIGGGPQENEEDEVSKF